MRLVFRLEFPAKRTEFIQGEIVLKTFLMKKHLAFTGEIIII
jgi:hypothetical protein